MLEKFFVNGDLIAKEVILGGEKHTLHFKELSAKTFTSVLSLVRSDNEENRFEGIVKLVELSLCNPDGTQAMTAEDVKKLRAAVLYQLFEVAMGINEAKKN